MSTINPAQLVEQGVSLVEARREFEWEYLSEALRLHNGHVTNTAKALGITRGTLTHKAAFMGIVCDDFRPWNLQRHRGRRRTYKDLRLPVED